jgi:hypothetical protein
MVQHMPDRPRKLRHMRMVWMLVLLGFGTLLALAVLLFADAGHADAAGLGGVTDAVSRTTAAATATLHDAGVVPPVGSAPVPLPGVPAPAQPVVDSLPATASTVVDPVLDTVAPMAGPVRDAVTPMTDILDPVLAPVLDPLVSPILDSVVAPITRVVGPVVAPITGIVDRIAPPVVHPVVPRSGGHGAAATPTVGGLTLAIPRHAPALRGDTPPSLVASSAVSTPTIARPVASPSVPGEASASIGGESSMPALPTAPARNVPAAPFPSTTSASTNGSAPLQLLLFAVGVSLAVFFGPRARRIWLSGVAQPRFAFLSLTERPG